MTKECTWARCNNLAAHVERGNDRKVWAYLCDKHHEELEKGLDVLDAKTLIKNWVLAQGGSKGAAERMLGKKYE
tara:strand:- start:10668 stop:10889 length:222 start_codon:yes stop_codon:yes gene_type:complete